MTKQIVNRYAGKCQRCASPVAAGAGFAQLDKPKGEGGKWATVCTRCAGEAPEAPVASASSPSPRPREEPTDEQREALALFGRADHPSFVIEAGAGCGKTSTARMLAESTSRLGAYMAFNRAIVDDAREAMPRSMMVKTVHGYAFAAVGKVFQPRFKSPRVSSTALARRLGVEPYYASFGQETKVLQPGFLASHVKKAAKRFCNSEDTEPATKHFEYIDGIDVPLPDGRRTWHHNDTLREALLPALRKMWADWQDPQGDTPYEMDAYVKMWELGDPAIPVDYIVVDEAQDLSGVMVGILRKNQARDVQLVAIGDGGQVIYQWRGTQNVFDMPELFPGGRTTLTTSFRFGQPIADVANLLLEKATAPIRLVGNPDRESTIGPADAHDAVMCRTNAATIREMFLAMTGGKRFFLVGGGEDVASFCRGAEELQLMGRTDHPELACFSSWSQVQDYIANDPAGDELKLMVKMIDDHGAATIREALGRQTAKAKDADLVLSTVHKSKGLQFDRVRLGSDFAQPGEGPSASPEGALAEWRLLYVAATRAKYHLDHSDCGPVWALTNPPEEDLEAGVQVIAPEHDRRVALLDLHGITDAMSGEVRS